MTSLSLLAGRTVDGVLFQVINPKQESIACLDPIGLAASKQKTAELDFIK